MFLKTFMILGVLTLLVLPVIGVADGTEKITICHATGSKTNPYVEIRVSVEGLHGHINHQGDIIPSPLGGCRDLPPPVPT